ncbi:hypothetical protein OGAPHI_005909 [Ogataea philodendri]|uniref:Uncharacterized protein n=2 Tax=Ogataea TaxID=461281 RepID=A0A9P8T1I9_9ASCO|nr:uncharacterized protein OGAPHI_005909 [Ogataea philodendri]KAH3658646.1 hypothetical protein OGATHE_006816 [Ogataea polymorpha]KAH3661731.1 hypothetical protein OGAPHI_005909 [Ogataea philodendri]
MNVLLLKSQYKCSLVVRFCLVRFFLNTSVNVSCGAGSMVSDWADCGGVCVVELYVVDPGTIGESSSTITSSLIAFFGTLPNQLEALGELLSDEVIREEFARASACLVLKSDGDEDNGE